MGASHCVLLASQGRVELISSSRSQAEVIAKSGVAVRSPTAGDARVRHQASRWDGEECGFSQQEKPHAAKMAPM